MNDGVAVVLPALDEEGAVAEVVRGFRQQGARVVVIDNGSRDDTATRAEAAGAEVVHEPRRGYGAACLAGLHYLTTRPPRIVVFADCDGTLDPRDLSALTGPIEGGTADLVLGRRTRIARGALPFKNRIARWMACVTFLVLYGVRLHDLGPFRALRWSTAETLGLSHPTYGLPVETVARAARAGARIVEVDVSYHPRRFGSSKVGTNPFQAAWIAVVMTAVAFTVRFSRRPG